MTWPRPWHSYLDTSEGASIKFDIGDVGAYKSVEITHKTEAKERSSLSCECDPQSPSCICFGVELEFDSSSLSPAAEHLLASTDLIYDHYGGQRYALDQTDFFDITVESCTVWTSKEAFCLLPELVSRPINSREAPALKLSIEEWLARTDQSKTLMHGMKKGLRDVNVSPIARGNFC